MKRFSLYAVVLAAAVTLTSAAAAAPGAANKRVGIAITTKGAYHDWNPSRRGKFVLTPLQAGALKRDSGTVGATVNTWRAEGRVAVLDHSKGSRESGGAS